MTTLAVTEDTNVAETFAAGGPSEIQLAFETAIARLAVISQDWEKARREALQQWPTSPSEPSGLALSQAA